MSKSMNRSLTPLAVALGMVAVGVGGYVAGHRNSGPAPQPGQVAEGTHAEGGEEGHEHEAGVIRFDEKSLKRTDIQVEPITYRAVQSQLQVTGTVQPDLGGVVKITPRVAGKITSVRVNVGDTIRNGQVLATLASTDLAAAQAAYRQAGSRVTVALANLERQKKLAGLGEFSRHQVEEARDRSIAAQGEVNATLSELAAARNEVTEARSDLAALQGEVATAESEATSAESEIREAEEQVRALQAAQTQTLTQVKVAQSRFNRAELLLKEQLISRQDWEQSQADYQRAQSDVDAARANVAQGQAKIETARAHLKAAQAKVRAQRGRVDQAAARIETALARQAQVEARLAAARKRSEVAEQALAREERVFQGGYRTSKEVAEADAAYQQAKAEQRAAAETIRLLGGMPGGDNMLSVTAPIGGRITERLVTLGETVLPEKALFTLMNLSSVWVQLNVQQRDLPNVRMGQPVSITADAAPGRPFTGIVSYISDVVDETTRTVKVRCAIQSSRNLLRPDMFVRGTIRTNGQTQALAVPKDAVQSQEGKSVVFVEGDHEGEFLPKEVETGETTGGLTVIRSGLKAGDRLVTRGAFLVKAQGMKSKLGEEE